MSRRGRPKGELRSAQHEGTPVSAEALTFLIRTMRDEDLTRVIEILGAWGMAPVAPSVEHPRPERSGLAVGRTLVAESDGHIVGVASYVVESPRLAVTESLAVDPAWVGSGVAEALHCERLAILRALDIATVHTEADRPRTIAWYVKRFGYRVVGSVPKRHVFSLPDVAHWTLLELDLTREPRRR
jgi:N-acetylglutamate synthase-like GNAT family acetyltransferase